MPRFVLLLLIALLAACTPRAALVLAPDLVGANVVRPVFVSTMRKAEAGTFGAQRAQTPTYARYDIAVPPDREPGQISWPRGVPDPATQFLARDIEIFGAAGAFRSDLRRALLQRPSAQREAIIYVHGFNNSFAEGVLRITQLAHDFQFPGVAVHYSWPSAANPLGYAYDRDSTLYARDGLEVLIGQVRAAGAERIVLVAHSVGSMLVMEALRQKEIGTPGSVLRDIDGVILISPDLDIDLFRTQARRIGTLPQPFGIFVSKRDRVLNLSARLTGQRNRLGNVDRVDAVADLNVTVIDVSEFSTGAGHFTAGSSAAVIRIFSSAGALDAAFRGDRAGHIGLFPGTVLTVQNATAIILSPVTALAGAAAQ